MRYLLLFLLAGCQASYSSTSVMHRISDDAIELAQRASPETEWELEVDPDRDANYSYSLPHTELVTLRGRVDDIPQLFENLEVEAVRTILRYDMHVRRDERGRKDGLRRHAWIYEWGSCQGVLTIWGREQENGDYTLCFTVHEARIQK